MSRAVRRLNSVAEVNDERETWKIAVRVLNMWTIPRGACCDIEAILVDKEGDKMLAQVKNVDVGVVNDIFHVGQCYVIQNFEVLKNTGDYKATRHGFKIKVVKTTKITPHQIAEIPECLYSFTKFDSILDGSATPDYLVDVIGQLVEPVQWELDGKPKKVFFNLRDECGTLLSCTLWEALAVELKNLLNQHLTGPVVFMLTMAKIKEPRGRYPLCIQNSMYGSHIFVNSNIKEILEFKDGLTYSMDPSERSTKGYSQIGSQICGSSSSTNVDRFLYNAHVKNLDQLNQLTKECMCVTVGTIQKLLVANGWVYDACPKCNKKIDGQGSVVVCVGCGHQSARSIPRYRIDVSVTQARESAIFTLWDRHCVALIKETADELKQKIIAEEGDFDPRDIPESLDRVLGKKLAFRFKALPGNTRYSVSQISEDETLVNNVVGQLSTIDIQDKTDPSMACMQRTDDAGYTQCLSEKLLRMFM